MTTLSLAQAITAFTQFLTQEGKAACTVAIYQHDLQLLARVLGAPRRPLSLDRVTAAELQEAIRDPQWTHLPDGQPLTAATICRRVTAARSFFRWACQVGLLDANPAGALIRPVVTRPLPGVLTAAEVDHLRTTVSSATGWMARRDQVLVECFLSVGLLLHEAVALTLDDLDLVVNRLRVGTATKYLNREIRAALAAYLPWRQAQTDVTTRALLLSQRGVALSSRSVASRIAYWLTRAGLPPGLSPKSLRYTFAVRLYRAQPNLRLVQQALGHVDLRSTAVYAVIMDGELETVMEGL
jgi:site-specific recombinase XerD